MGSGTSRLSAYVIVDDRERHLLESLDKSGAPFPVIRTRLNLGDIIVNGVLLERKTSADLAASLKDGRWKEQVSRLRTACGDLKPGVLVEGFRWRPANDTKTVGGVRETTLASCLLGCAFREGVPVLMSRDLRQTVDLIASIFRKTGIRAKPSDAPVHQSRRPKLKDSRELAVAHLCLVPGVSPRMADTLLGEHRSSVAWVESEGFSVERISDVRHGAAGKRIGRKLAASIVSLLTP